MLTFLQSLLKLFSIENIYEIIRYEDNLEVEKTSCAISGLFTIFIVFYNYNCVPFVGKNISCLLYLLYSIDYVMLFER